LLSGRPSFFLRICSLNLARIAHFAPRRKRACACRREVPVHNRGRQLGRQTREDAVFDFSTLRTSILITKQFTAGNASIRYDDHDSDSIAQYRPT
jgi:hypothetical protein